MTTILFQMRIKGNLYQYQFCIQAEPQLQWTSVCTWLNWCSEESSHHYLALTVASREQVRMVAIWNMYYEQRVALVPATGWKMPFWHNVSDGRSELFMCERTWCFLMEFDRPTESNHDLHLCWNFPFGGIFIGAVWIEWVWYGLTLSSPSTLWSFEWIANTYLISGWLICILTLNDFNLIFF